MPLCSALQKGPCENLNYTETRDQRPSQRNHTTDFARRVPRVDNLCGQFD